MADKLVSDYLTHPAIEEVGPEPGQFTYEPCEDCGHSVMFPSKIYPNKTVAKCKNCGTEYGDVDEEENDWFLSREDGAT